MFYIKDIWERGKGSFLQPLPPESCQAPIVKKRLNKLGLSCAKLSSSWFQAYSAKAGHGISGKLIGGVQLGSISWIVFIE